MSEKVEPKFTFGPWKVDEHAGIIWTVGDPYGHGPMHIADVRGWGHLTGRGACAFSDEKAAEIQDATAQLIATSPELYVRLGDLIDIIDKAGLLHLSNGVQLGQTSWYVKASERLEAARAAFAKATASSLPAAQERTTK